MDLDVRILQLASKDEHLPPYQDVNRLLYAAQAATRVFVCLLCPLLTIGVYLDSPRKSERQEEVIENEKKI
jgi:hypothetical protein